MSRRAARALRPYLPGLLAHCRYPVGTNRIKVIKRMANGLRGDACLFLKIRAAYPGVTR